MGNLTKSQNNKEEFDILESQINAYRRWGYTAGIDKDDFISKEKLSINEQIIVSEKNQ